MWCMYLTYTRSGVKHQTNKPKMKWNVELKEEQSRTILPSRETRRRQQSWWWWWWFEWRHKNSSYTSSRLIVNIMSWLVRQTTLQTLFKKKRRQRQRGEQHKLQTGANNIFKLNWNDTIFRQQNDVVLCQREKQCNCKMHEVYTDTQSHIIPKIFFNGIYGRYVTDKRSVLAIKTTQFYPKTWCLVSSLYICNAHCFLTLSLFLHSFCVCFVCYDCMIVRPIISFWKFLVFHSKKFKKIISPISFPFHWVTLSSSSISSCIPISLALYVTLYTSFCVTPSAKEKRGE